MTCIGCLPKHGSIGCLNTRSCIECLNIHGTYVTANNSNNNNVVYFFVSDLEINYNNNN